MPTPRLSDEAARQVAELYDLVGVTEGARRAGITREAFKARLQVAIERGMTKRKSGTQAGPVDMTPPPIDPARLRSMLMRAPHTIDEVAQAFRVSRGMALDAIEQLRNDGANIHEHGGRWGIDRSGMPTRGTIPVYHSSPDGIYRFGFTSDNHLGSKYERLDVLESLYDHFEEANVDRVFNAGNWIDGEASFNRFDLKVHGMAAQLDYLARNYPQRDGIVTYAVAGDDHEGWYCQREGVDIGRMAVKAMQDAGREDWVDLGYMEAFVRLEHVQSGASTMLHLIHPGGGSAYAVSYTVQKIVESYSGGDKPAVLLAGHYHKMSYNFFRNVHCIQTGCFQSNTLITTSEGRVRISDIKIGDLVLTHKGRFRKVTRLFQRLHSGDMVSLNYSRKNRPDQTVTATPEHPILVERENGAKEWVEIANVKPGDVVFVSSKRCEVSGDLMPYWMQLSKNANPMDRQEARDKLASTRGPKIRMRGGSAGARHLERDIIPFCEEMERDGWRMVPVGADVIPDAIGFKDGKVVAFEIERSRGRLRAHKEKKYAGSAVGERVDEVRWIDASQRVVQPRSWYETDEETGFCKVVVVGVERKKLKRNVRVYNFEVEEDNSYVAGNVVVHNCTEDQTPFMRKKKLHADVGGGICELHQDAKTGAITACRMQFFPYFVREFYNDRWSHAHDVVLADRGA